ncbi:hypothetical protein BGZ65_000240 [Modicella reniformis]|uniref:Uncharacterized protein n=1 Tax=Modicella reniformis TaxID=1440133 RepID=A0A9P6LTU9_9FUNG|nr:hypothetical protein BGZ65_000240 [Modicella reniformis]
MLSALPTNLVVSPARFCFIVGFFNLNSLTQEVLCGFMWGMNYHTRPGWVVGAGTGIGFITGMVSGVLIALHERAMSQARVVATAEEAIQDVIDEKKHAS